MKKFRWPAMALLIVCLLAGCVPATTTSNTSSIAPRASVLTRILQRGELVVGTAASMPPLNMATKQGDIIGLDVDLCKYMAASMGVGLKLVPMAFADLLPALQAGKVDMVVSGMTITPRRNLKVAFVGPYFVSGKAFLTKKKTLAAVQSPAKINSSKMSLAALNGSTSQEFVEQALPESKLITTKDYGEAVKLVLNDRVDAMVADFPICVISVAQHPEAGLVSVTNLLSYEPLGVAIPAGDSHFINWVDNFLNTMHSSGELEILEHRWFENADWLKDLP